MPRLSVLDLSPIIEGGDAALAFRNTADLAQPPDGATVIGSRNITTFPASPARRLRSSSGTSPAKRKRSGLAHRDHVANTRLVIAEQFGARIALSRPDRSQPGPREEAINERAAFAGIWDSGDTFPKDVIELQS
jgi:hypothetical protein